MTDDVASRLIVIENAACALVDGEIETGVCIACDEDLDDCECDDLVALRDAVANRGAREVPQATV